MPSNVCTFWACEERIKSGHYACREHYTEVQAATLDECPSCDNLKKAEYEMCRPCEQRAGSRTSASRTREQRGSYETGVPPAWAAGDAKAGEFYAYILKLNDGGFYAGQTRNLRVRMTQHRDGTGAKAAQGKDPQLVWFAEVPDRKMAMAWESELSALIKRNPTQVREMCLHFLDLSRELGSL